MYKTSKVHPIEVRLCAASIRVEGCGGELETMVTKHGAVDDVIVSETGVSPSGGREKHFTSCTCEQRWHRTAILTYDIAIIVVVYIMS